MLRSVPMLCRRDPWTLDGGLAIVRVRTGSEVDVTELTEVMLGTSHLNQVRK